MLKNKKFMTCDGNCAAAHVAYMFSEVAAIYPITPSSPMAELIDEWSAGGRKNLFGERVKVVEMESEAGAAGAVHGSLQAGALTTTYTASQGLLLMIPNMYKIAGELLPAVFHVTARSLASQALSIFGDHADVMATRQTGFAMLSTASVQEVMDLAPVAHLAAIKGRVPFMHFFDGFRTSHEIQKIEAWDMEELRPLVDQDALRAFRERALNPEHPVTRGTAQNSDIYFQTREIQNKYYDAIPDIVNDYMQKINALTGRHYAPFTYYGAKDATDIIIAMGSVTETTKTVCDYLNAQGKKTGVITVHLYRPFSVKYLLDVLPATVKNISVLDRTKEPGANGDPLYMDVVEALRDRNIKIIGGRYGLSSKDTTPAQIISVFNNLMGEQKNQFTIGIVDDVTHHSLPVLPEIAILPKGTFEARFYGLGADGTVGANKNSIKIIGDNTDKYSQAYFDYDSKKSGGYTCSHLRFGDNPLPAPYLVGTPDFVAVHVPSYLRKYDCLRGLKDNGTFLYNSPWTPEETKEELPDFVKKYLAVHHITMYIINATKIAAEIGLGNRTNTILQSAFFKISQVIPYDLAVEQMKKFIVKSYGRKGEDVVNKNYKAVERGGEIVKIDIPAEWANLNCTTDFVPIKGKADEPEFITKVMRPMMAQCGNDLPVSAFTGYEDGTFPAGTTAYEKRGVATVIPAWNPDACIQCNQCSLICPHAAIRPVVMTDEEKAKAPASMETLHIQNPKEFIGMHFRIQVSALDCTGCGNCVDVCPAPTKALEMKPLDTQMQEAENWEYSQHNVTYKDNLIDKKATIKHSQFAQPLFEFSGACAGCGETPYLKNISQLFGEQMMVANATGCSSIYSASAPATPYCKNNRSGYGPAWANSLFEDNAEFGLGMATATRQQRDSIQHLMEQAIAECDKCSAELKGLFKDWIENRECTRRTKEISDKMIPMMEACGCDFCKKILEKKHLLVKKSQWIFGGDGWGYDIGFGGLDHVLASGEDVNVVVVDTEVYSNTGGQSSKATPAGAVAKFATSGKKIRKKDLGMIAKSYGYVYVAQVALGASQSQYFKVIKEAEAYHGPSLIICYAPCINHGIKVGMGHTQTEEKMAVECGYWHLWHFNPEEEDAGKNGFHLDSKEPDWSKFRSFLMGEVRYNSLTKTFPEQADELFAATERFAKIRYEGYKKLSEE